MQSTPVSLPEWVQIVQALGPSTIAAAAFLITAYIAWRQWKTAHDKLRFDLFSRRYAYFLASREFLGSIMRKANMTDEAFSRFIVGTEGYEFLLTNDQIDFVNNVRMSATRLRALIDELDVAKEEQRKDLIDKKYKELAFLNDSFSSMVRVFSSSLRFN